MEEIAEEMLRLFLLDLAYGTELSAAILLS